MTSKPIPKPTLEMIALGEIDAQPEENMRRHYSLPELQKLMNSIVRTGGLITPIILEKNGKKKIRGGFRRFFSYKELERMYPGYFPKIKSKIYENLTPEQRLAIMVAENVCKEKIPNVELARGLWELYKFKLAKATNTSKQKLDKYEDYWKIDSKLRQQYSMSRFAEETDKAKDYIRRAFLHQRLHSNIEKDVGQGRLGYTIALEFARIHSKQEQVQLAKRMKHRNKGKYPRTSALKDVIKQQTMIDQEKSIMEIMETNVEDGYKKEKQAAVRSKISSIRRNIKRCTKFLDTFTELITLDDIVLQSSAYLAEFNNQLAPRDVIEKYDNKLQAFFNVFEKSEGFEAQKELEILLGKNLEAQFQAYLKKKKLKKTLAPIEETELHYIPLEKVKIIRNVRETYVQASLNELAANFKEVGQLEPITLRPIGKDYQIVDGHRRFLATQIAGIKTIEAIVKEMTDEEAALYQIEADVYQNVSLHEIAETVAMLYSLLKEKYGKDYSMKKFCDEHQGLKAQVVAKSMKYYLLDESIKTLSAAGLISHGSAIELGKIKDQDARYEAALTVVLRGLKAHEVVAAYKEEQEAAKESMFTDFDMASEQKARKRKDLINLLNNHIDVSMFFDKSGNYTLERLADKKEIASALYEFRKTYNRLTQIVSKAT
ncbi:ParB/RepB/Spo0J family partition protein [Candidatus Woesearchaeota archaeon]|nr:ParB/RepB/Spo0J family partition protein [Candidatus Woesearchaeota archaeon]